MRYAIIFFSTGVFLLWDGWFNRGIYLDQFIRDFYSVLAFFGLSL